MNAMLTCAAHTSMYVCVQTHTHVGGSTRIYAHIDIYKSKPKKKILTQDWVQDWQAACMCACKLTHMHTDIAYTAKACISTSITVCIHSSRNAATMDLIVLLKNKIFKTNVYGHKTWGYRWSVKGLTMLPAKSAIHSFVCNSLLRIVGCKNVYLTIF